LASVARDPAAFRTILRGRSGVTRPYDLWRRFRAVLSGHPYEAEHAAATRPEAPRP
jgi:hypothetical protein